MSNAVAVAGVVLAAAAFVVSLYALAYSRRAMEATEAQALAAKTQTRLDTERERERRTAQRKAAVRATLTRRRLGTGPGTPTSGRITLHNDGPAPATDVKVDVRQGEPPALPESVRAAMGGIDTPEVVFRHVRPVSEIAPATPAHFPLVVHDWMASRYVITLTWTNADGSPGRWSSEVTVDYED